jgi:branched-chain amino acid aminotransferase
MSTAGFDALEGSIWMDGQFYHGPDARIHVLTHGLHYASSVFEGERAYGGRIFRMHDHSQRLIQSANMLGMTVPYTAEEIDAIKMQTLKENGLDEAYVRAFAWRGSEQMGISAKKTQVHLAVACWHWPNYFSSSRNKGIALKRTNWRKPDPRTMPTGSKASGLYAVNTLVKHEVEDAGFDDALMLGYRGTVAEATTANIFFVKDSTLITPEPDCFLNGLTRQTIIDLAGQHNIPVAIRDIMPDEVRDMEEVFITGTAAEVTAVGQIDDTHYDVGPVTRQLRETYERYVRE